VTSFRARALSAYLRATARRRWRPDMDIAEIRARAAALDGRLGRRLPPIAIEDCDAGGVPAKWFGSPELGQSGTVLYLHGGAWCLHLPHLYRQFATRLSARIGMRVLLPDYRLAPEHPFPAGVEDCYAVYRWLIEHGQGDQPLFMAGDSAGGSLTAVTLMRARDAGLPLPRAAALLSPSTDLTMSGASQVYNEPCDAMFSARATSLLPAMYCPGVDRTHPWLSPLFGSWRGLPPLAFHVGSTEMLLDDSIRAHDRARAAGVEAQLKVWPGMPHVFQIFAELPEAEAGLREVVDFLLAHGRADAHAPAANASRKVAG
jgi:monoterpene epsilon-lactone hydrolase